MQLSLKKITQFEWSIAIAITAAAIALHVYFWLHIGGLWRDEVNLVNISRQHTFDGMIRDSFPIAMPLALHSWLTAGLGENDLSLRFLGLLIGLGIPATLWISSWKIHRRPPLLSLVLFALNGPLIMFGDSLRAYGLGSLCAVALTASAFVFLQKRTLWNAIWLMVFAIFSVQVLYNNAVLVSAVCFGAWAVCWHRKDWSAAFQILTVAVVSAASLLPYLHFLIFASGTSGILRSGVELSRFFGSYNNTLGYPLSGYTYVWVLLCIVILIYACPGLHQRASSPPLTDNKFSDVAYVHDLKLFGAVTLTLASIGFPIFFWRAQLPMQSWYVLPFMACLAVCFDAALPAFKGTLRIVILGFTVATALISVPTTSKLLKGHFSDINVYASGLNILAMPQDYIIVEPWFYGITFNYYFKGATPWETLPPLADHSTHHFDAVQTQLLNTNAIMPVLQQIARTLQSGHRVWVLAAKGWMGVPGPNMRPPPSLPPAPLKDTGWADWPYTQVWAAQVACFAVDHSNKFGQIKNTSTEQFITEDMVLFAADGWKTNSPAP